MPDELHSSLSPSGRHRWGACPGSVQAEAPYPDSEGQAAIDGTRTHSLLERLVKYEFVDKEDQCGTLPCWNEKITDEYGTFVVDADRANRLNVALEWIRNFVDENGGTVIPERRVHPDGLVGRADMHGTVDIQIVNKRVYPVFDYKDGMHPVSAVENPQLEQYAMGVLAELAPENYPKKFLLVICQPKLKMKGLPVISTWEITPTELLARVPIIIAQAAATEAPNAPLVPGEAQCKYCKAKGTCSAIAKQAMEGIGAMFSPVIQPEPHGGMFTPAALAQVQQDTSGGGARNPWSAAKPAAVPSFLSAPVAVLSFVPMTDPRNPTIEVSLITPAPAPGFVNLATPPIDVVAEVMPAGTPDMNQLLAARDPNKMDDKQLCQLMEAAPLVKQLLDGVKAEIERRLHSGQKVAGYKLVQGKGSREWALDEAEMVKKLTGMGIPKSAIYTEKMVSPAQAEKLVWDKKGEPCALSDQQKKRMETEYIKKIPGAPVVAAESDSRPAIGPIDASPLFSPVTPPSNYDAIIAAPVPSFLAAPKPSFL